jgi:hypothetical protein
MAQGRVPGLTDLPHVLLNGRERDRRRRLGSRGNRLVASQRTVAPAPPQGDNRVVTEHPASHPTQARPEPVG